MRLLCSFVLLALLAGQALGSTCFAQLQKGQTMEQVIAVCGEPSHRKDLGSDMKVKSHETGQARVLTIAHGRTETLWVYEGETEFSLRFVNGELVEKEQRPLD